MGARVAGNAGGMTFLYPRNILANKLSEAR